MSNYIIKIYVLTTWQSQAGRLYPQTRFVKKEIDLDTPPRDLIWGLKQLRVQPF